MTNHMVFVWGVCLLMVIAANLSYFSTRLFLVRTCPSGKSMWLRLLEVLVYGGLTGVLGMWGEASLGQSAPQRWEFYAAFLCLFVTLGFPGFVWRYLAHGSR